MIPLAELEKHHIIRALQQTGQNRTHAAKLLGISVRTLRNKLAEYGVTAKDEHAPRCREETVSGVSSGFEALTASR